jgi:hypothetical protein
MEDQKPRNEFWVTKLVRVIGAPGTLALLAVWAVVIIVLPILLPLAIGVFIYEKATGKPAPWKPRYPTSAPPIPLP